MCVCVLNDVTILFKYNVIWVFLPAVKLFENFFYTYSTIQSAITDNPYFGHPSPSFILPESESEYGQFGGARGSTFGSINSGSSPEDDPRWTRRGLNP